MIHGPAASQSVSQPANRYPASSPPPAVSMQRRPSRRLAFPFRRLRCHPAQAPLPPPGPEEALGSALIGEALDNRSQAAA